MQVNLNASINTASVNTVNSFNAAGAAVRFNSGRARLSSPVVPTNFNTAKAMPGDVVRYRDRGAASVVQNTPEERKALREAIAAHLPRFHFWTGYIGEVNNAMGVNHYWEIPSSQINRALAYVDSMFQSQPVYPSYSQAPLNEPEAIPEEWEDAKLELEAVINQFEAYRKWFKEQADLMEHAVKCVNSTLAALK